jgi:acetyl-CoA C-acetyltransferase
MKDIVICSAVRTAIGSFGKSLAPIKAADLGAIAVREAVARAGIDPDRVDEVIMGNVVSAGIGQNPARIAALRGGIPASKGCFTVNKVCGSGMKALHLASMAIQTGFHDVVLVGGMESMSNAPYIVHKMRTGARLGDATMTDTMIFDGLWDIHNDFHMGNTGELVADKYDISREAQDEYAAESHSRAVAAIEGGNFKKEITPVEIPQRKGDPVIFDTDEHPRPGTTAEKLAKLRPAFKKDGTVTAGNASGINDAAAALIIASAEAAEKEGLKPLARITGMGVGSREPEWVMLAPIDAVNDLKRRTGAKIEDFDLVEVNEPFAVASIALIKDIGLNPKTTNIHGGAVALGHPIGCTGARLIVTLIHALQQQGKKTGLATLCLGGGSATATSIELL